MFYDVGMSAISAKRTPTRRRRTWRRPLRWLSLTTEGVRAVSAAKQIGTKQVHATTQQGAPTFERALHRSTASDLERSQHLVADDGGRDFVTLRRVEDQGTASCEILQSMDWPTDASDAEVAAGSPDGLSAFVARIFDQLALSAWLPAAFLSASLALLLQFRADKSVDLLRGVRALTADPVRVLVLIVPVLVLSTVVTQAFSFEAIRTLEGYWHRRGVASLARTLMIKRQVHRARSLAKRRQRACEIAYYTAEPRMLRKGVSPALVNAMKAQALELEDPAPLTDEEMTELEMRNWESWCNAWEIAKIEHLRDAEGDYPLEPHRILPTKLGNLIRATEDQLKNTEDDVQGFALRRYAGTPRLIRAEHDKFRSRLEMYCTLVFVSGSLLILTPTILFRAQIGIFPIITISACFGVLSQASYLAAIASARGYCSALKEMDRNFPSST
jgi:hypothetical protein